MMLQRECIHINHKKVYRLYKKAGLALKHKLKRKIYAKRGTPDRSHLLGPNDRWSIDFVSDIAATGRRFRIFALIDEVTRECITLEVDISITGQHVTRCLNKAMLFRGRSKEILSNNGPEFTGNALNACAYKKQIEHVINELGYPQKTTISKICRGKPNCRCRDGLSSHPNRIKN